MVDGKFYDASAYKASPVPMAIWGETVYEAVRTGVSQGLFTVADAIKSKDSWFGDGKWQPAGSAPAKRHTDTKPKLDDDEGPPKLRRPESQKPATPATPPVVESPAAKAPPPATPAPPTTNHNEPAPAADSTTTNDADPSRPILQRGKSQTLGSTQPPAPPSTPGAGASKALEPKPADKAAEIQLMPAISDAGGPDPRPYAYDLKPDEEQKFRKKMLALASEAVQARARQILPLAPGAKPGPRSSPSARVSAKGPQPSFENVQFHAFDLSNTNEPVFVWTATAQMPQASAAADLTYFVTLVTKEDIYGDLRKLQTSVTDTRHLDEIPRMELIDAVDADGDGRGELLFRQVWDAGRAWAIYRASADRLFPLFQGTPSGP